MEIDGHKVKAEIRPRKYRSLQFKYRATTVLGDLLGVDGLIGAPDQRCKRTVVAVGINPVDALVLDSSDARAEAQAQLGIAVGIGVVFFDLELALVVKQTVQHKGGITIGALNRQAEKGA